jgi:hypothetical protein
MPAHPITKDQMTEAVRIVDMYGGNVSEAARESGIAYATLYARYTRAKGKPVTSSERAAPNEARLLNQWTESGESAEFSGVVSKKVRTLAELMKVCGCDESIWEVDTWACTAWTTAMKLKQVDPDGGREKIHRPHTEQNYRVTAKFKRKFPRRLEMATDALIERIKKHAPRLTIPKRSATSGEPHMLEISPYDVHFGKLAWAQETGTDYDLSIASKVFCNAFDELLSDTRHVGIEKILLPIGQDFLHFDALIGMAVPTTMNGTPQDVDGRWAKVFETASTSVLWAIERCLSRAPVQIVWVPGNHDWFNSYHLCREVSAYFHACKQLDVDLSPKSRKYVGYGKTLIGLAHGDLEKHHDLPNIMAGEVPQLWAGATAREWHLGHYHKKKETRYNEGDTWGSVRVVILPSLSGTDAWHYRKGYVNTPRACEARLYSKSRGLRAYFNSPVLN